MLQLFTGLQTWWAELTERASEERGATAVEYALMVALIAVVIIVAVTFLGSLRATSSSRSGTQSPAPSYPYSSSGPVGRSRLRLRAAARGADGLVRSRMRDEHASQASQ